MEDFTQPYADKVISIIVYIVHKSLREPQLGDSTEESGENQPPDDNELLKKFTEQNMEELPRQ